MAEPKTTTPAKPRKKAFRPSKQMKKIIADSLVKSKADFKEKYGNDENPYFDAAAVLAEFDEAIANFTD